MMPWNVPCPFDLSNLHTLRDACSELFEEYQRREISQGKKAAMLCPVCGKPWTFPRGWFSNPVSGVGLPISYWSQRIWDTYNDQRKDDIRQRVPNVEGLLR
jgi:hypothetical protein